MKKSLLLLAICILSGGLVFGQVGLNIGVKGGLNLSTLGADATDVKSATGFHIGAFGGVKFTKFGVDIEALFSAQGADDDLTDAEINTDYLVIPVLAKFYIVSGLNIYAGPQFGILLKSEIEDPSFGTIDIEDFTSSSDISLVVGAGFEVSRFRVGARYNIGISNYIDDPLAFSSFGTDPKFTNQVFQLYAGFSLLHK